MIDGKLTQAEWDGRSLVSLVAEWRAGPLPEERKRESLDRLSKVRVEVFSRLRCPDSIAGRAKKAS